MSSNFYRLYAAGPGLFTELSQTCAELFNLLPRLLPRHFVRIVQSVTMEKLRQLELFVKTEPWIFGFSNVSIANES
jgi:hypothetical protein